MVTAWLLSALQVNSLADKMKRNSSSPAIDGSGEGDKKLFPLVLRTFKVDVVVAVCWLLNIPATCECISGTDLHRQFHVLPH